MSEQKSNNNINIINNNTNINNNKQSPPNAELQPLTPQPNPSNASKSTERIYQFHINNSPLNKQHFKYPDNTIKTTKYNIFTFLPKALFFQFLRPANIYFLIVAIINCIPIISPLGSGIALVPIIFVLAVSLIRELIEDIIRAKIDREQNNEIIDTYQTSTNQWIKTRSGELNVGEIIRINQDETFPSDVILLTSNLPEGLCYIETGSLDGEKSLKIKQSPIQTATILPDENIGEISGLSICDMPNPYLYHLIGRMKINVKGQLMEIPLDSKQLLLKGAKLRNTKWIIGVIVYAGNDCKIMLNSKKPRMKYSKIESLMNKMLLTILIFQFILCVICAILHKVYHNQYLKHNPFLDNLTHSLTVDCVINYFSYLLLLNTMIPISLIITLEIVKILQVLLMLWDADGISFVNMRNIKPHSVSLNEELGQVDYIFTDKTGTLTCNKMAFKYCVIGDVCYEYVKEKEKEKLKDRDKDKETFTPEQIQMRDMEDIIQFTKGDMHRGTLGGSGGITGASMYPNVNLRTTEKSAFVLNTSYKIIEEFWKALALCHDCTIDGEGDKEDYIGLSPDSIELVRAAREQGYCLINSEKTSIRRLAIGSEDTFINHQDYEKLLLMEFTSDRKRESIVVNDNGTIKMYIKGADSIIEQRLSYNTPKIFLDQSQRYVNHFSSQGYRTLFIAMKIFEENEWKAISANLKEANLDLQNKHKRLNAIYDSIEQDLYLIGATIVEDKLQDKVPETISDLKAAGIKIWMLTGDKMSTAYNIALSCNLLNKDLKIFFLEGKVIQRNDKLVIVNQAECEEVIITFGKQFAKFVGESPSLTHDSLPFGIVIDEKALVTVTDNPEMSRLFLNIAKDAKSIICCRVSPLQKSQVVKMMKDYDSTKTLLSIGDGGNDVSMIMEANIGIGIYGEEGLRAVQSSDYAIGEFKILRRLLMFHGRTNNIRICDMINYFFYKNFIFTINHFFYGFYTNFSGQTIIDDWFINMYNLLFTAFPLGCRACMDFDIKPEDGTVIDHLLPYLYLDNKRRPNFTKTSFVLGIFKGILHAVINYFVTIYIYYDQSINSKGDIGDLWFLSVALYSNIILIVTVDLLVQTKFHTWMNFAIVGVLTLFAYVIFLIIVENWTLFNSVATMVVAFRSGSLWLCMLLVTSVCGLCAIGWSCVEMNFGMKMSLVLMGLVKRYGKVDDMKIVAEYKVIRKYLGVDVEERRIVNGNGNGDKGKEYVMNEQGEIKASVDSRENLKS